MGLLFLKKKIKLNNFLSKYFTNQYYMPSIRIKLVNHLSKFANSSIDISDGLLSDLEKLINNQKLSYKLNLRAIPISYNLKKVLQLKKLSKINFISKGDDYQILFTASQEKSGIIKKISSKLSVKITKIGIIQNKSLKSSIIEHNNVKITLKNKGYHHKF